MNNEDQLLSMGEQSKVIFLIDSDIELLKKIGRRVAETYTEFEVLAMSELNDVKEEIKQQRPLVIIISLDLEGDQDSIQFIKDLRDNPMTEKIPVIVTANRGSLEKKSDQLSSLDVEFVPKAIRIPFFMGVLSSCMQKASAVEFEKLKLLAGDILFNEGDESLSVFILKSGKLNVFKNIDGHQVQIAEIQGHKMVGEMAFLDQQLRSATIKAAIDSELIQLKLGSAETFLGAQPFWMSMMIKTLVERLRETNDEILKLKENSKAD